MSAFEVVDELGVLILGLLESGYIGDLVDLLVEDLLVEFVCIVHHLLDFDFTELPESVA